MANKLRAGVSRRSVLELGAKGAAAFGVSGVLAPLASAAGLQRACVCVYLLGGNDSNNMIVPLDPSAYAVYARGRGNLALPAESLLPVTSPSSSATYGFHPALGGVQDLYNRGILSVIANVGRTERPVGKGQVDPHQVPSDFFLHSTDPQVSYLPGGVLKMNWDPAGSTISPPDPVTNAGRSLRQKLEQVASELNQNNSRTTYTVTLTGFDTHAGELDRQKALFAELNDGLVSFYDGLELMGLAGRVTVFTATEFNRTLAPNSTGGTGHAWGGHNLVLGGCVRGGEVYGRFPSLELGGADDLGTSGTWIPSISDQQFSATIARWYGVPDLSRRFPHLGNFAAQPDLNFLASN